MTYTFKLSRRIARLRAAGLAAATLAVLGCDGANSFEPDGGTPAAAAPAAADLASASFAGGIPFGHFSLPYSWLGSTYNSTMTLASPKTLRDVLGSAKNKGARLVVNFTGSPRYYVDAAGNFSLSKWKQRMDRYKGVNLDDFVRDGTVIGHWLIDEPNDPTNWNGTPVSPATVEEMARYSKQYWPNLPTIVRADPSYLSSSHRYLDVAWAQYLYRRGDATDYVNRAVRDAQARGLALIVGMNVLKGGNPNGTRMSASEIKTWGSALLSSAYPCAFISWKFDESYLSASDIRAAMADLRARAQNRATGSCRRTDGATTPPPPPEDSPTPEPIGNPLPFGLAGASAEEYAAGWTGAAYDADPSGLPTRLSRAQSAGVRLVVQLAPAARTKNADGTFSLAKWKAEVDRYRSLSLGGYIRGKTLYLHLLVDRPRCARCWGGKPIPWKTIEEMARYSKSIWSGLPTTVRLPPSALAKSGLTWTHLDAAWAQYSIARGDLRTWLSAEVSKAKAAGLGMVGGLNLLNGSSSGSALSPTQIRDLGRLLVQEPALCAAIGWRYDATYLNQSGVRDALAAVASAAGAREPASCVVN